MSSLKGKTAIVGYGETKVGKIPEMDYYQLNELAITRAIEDANIERDEIDGLLNTSHLTIHQKYSNLMSCSSLVEYMKIYPKYATEIATGWASPCTMAGFAASAIASGYAETILCVAGDNGATAGVLNTLEEALMFYHAEFEVPYGMTIFAEAAMLARRYKHEYGIKREQLARIAVAERKNALMHPNAAHRDPITIDDVLNSEGVAEPLHLLDYAGVHDGGGAFIVTSAEKAKKLTDTPVYILGFGEYIESYSMLQSPNLTTSPAGTAGEMAFKMAGIKPQEVDVAEIYDPSTVHVLTFLEDLGFCRKGEGGKFVEENDLSFKGNVPLNTHGGLLSYGNPGLPGGIFHIIEATCQLMERGGKRQVKNAEMALVHNGSLSEHSVLILGR